MLIKNGFLIDPASDTERLVDLRITDGLCRKNRRRAERGHPHAGGRGTRHAGPALPRPWLYLQRPAAQRHAAALLSACARRRKAAARCV